MEDAHVVAAGGATDGRGGRRSESRRRLPRRNTSVADTAGWLVALLLLALVVSLNEVVARNTFFLRVHDTSPLAWLAGQGVAVALGWGLVVLVLRVAARRGARTFDVTATALTVLVAWLGIGNVLVRTILPDPPSPAPPLAVVGLWLAAGPLAVGVALLARQVRMGSVLLGFAALAAVLPLGPAVAASGPPTGSVEFDARAERPSVLWIVADELQYQLVFDETGTARPQFPALARLQRSATTYSRAFAPASSTDLAIPAMMAGIADVTSVPPDDFDALRDADGLLPELDQEFAMAWSSPLFGPTCDNDGCDERSSGVIARATQLVRDSVAVIGSTALAPPLNGLTPPITGKWRDFGDEEGRASWPEIGPQVLAALDRDPDAPFFAFWHDMETHVPWYLDADGAAIYPSGLPDVDAVDVGYTRAGDVTTPELTVLQRRLYAASTTVLDRRIGQLLDALEARGALDRTLVVLTADHGAAVGQPRRDDLGGDDERRIGATPVQAWEEIAHVPLLVKAPEQRTAAVVEEPRSTAQILATVLATVGATATTSWSLAPPLSDDLSGDPVFVTRTGQSLAAVPYAPVTGAALEVDAELAPAVADYPFAVGVPADVLGSAVPDGWVPVEPLELTVPDGSSAQRLLVVSRSARACRADDAVGLVSLDRAGGLDPSSADVVVGSVLWEKDGNDFAATVRGWAIVPAADADEYRLWCRTPDV